MRVQCVAVLLLAGLPLSGCGYNRIQALDERTEELKSAVGRLMRRG